MTIYDKLSSKSYYCRSLKIYAAFSRVPKQLPRTVSSLVVFGEVGEMRISPCFILIIYCKPICCSSMSSFFRSMHFCWKGMRLHCLFSWDLQVVTNTVHPMLLQDEFRRQQIVERKLAGPCIPSQVRAATMSDSQSPSVLILHILSFLRFTPASQLGLWEVLMRKIFEYKHWLIALRIASGSVATLYLGSQSLASLCCKAHHWVLLH